MRSCYRALLGSSILAIIAAVLFVSVRRRDTLAYAFAYAPIHIAGVDLYVQFRWVFVPALMLGGWSWLKLRTLPERQVQRVTQEGSLASPKRRAAGVVSGIAMVTVLIAAGSMRAHPGQIGPPLAAVLGGGAMALFIGSEGARWRTRATAWWKRVPGWTRDFVSGTGLICTVAVYSTVIDGDIEWPAGFVRLAAIWLLLAATVGALHGWRAWQCEKERRAYWPEHGRLSDSELSSLRQRHREEVEWMEREWDKREQGGL